MAQTDFFDQIEELPPFSDSEYTSKDVPDDALERAVLLKYMTRHYYPLSVADILESMQKTTDFTVTENEVGDAFDGLVEQGYITNSGESEYELNKNNPLVRVVQDTRIEYVQSTEY